MSLCSRKFLYQVLGILFCSLALTSAFAEEPPPLSSNCPQTFAATGKCPREICDYGCFTVTEDGAGCLMACREKPCIFIKNQFCPADRCQILKSCDDTEICYYKFKGDSPACGTIGYNGQDAQCCSGLVKRCGVDLLDGSCNMSGKNSIYAVPSCIPCGNRICDQFENKCNCPEDCG
ncbi:MAG: hypothetical protein A3D10_01250 [Omnitrophica WOR_2 bacterium RIFCSPHIGHO2_02_FULL_48_11]|nr:MAG: hypothetical protein A3D10_01250 [Omnitrophica WOR_2 bacterium RIFCSPHIGHO2_02_FULL_48_11]